VPNFNILMLIRADVFIYETIVVLTLVQACTVGSAFCQCVVVFRCDFTVKMEAVCGFESLVPTHDIKHNNT
jgi:hypothetical protein